MTDRKPEHVALWAGVIATLKALRAASRKAA